MGPRRTHTKSKKGCQSCKTRKIKCDEAKPSCQNCLKHGVICAYSTQFASPSTTKATNTTTPDDPSASSNYRDQHPRSTSIRVNSQSILPPAIGMPEVALVHHYSTSTCFTLSRNPILQRVWQVHIPQYAFSCPFVFQEILALSAFHLCHLRPKERAHYEAQAERHHNLALQMASSILPDINEKNSPTLYIFSIIACIISCAESHAKCDIWTDSNRCIEWLNLFRGTTAILKAGCDSFRAGPLSPMFTAGQRRSLAWEARSGSNQPFLLELRRLLLETVDSPDHLKCYHDAIDNMGKSFATVAEIGSQNCETSDIFIWLLRISDEYLTLLRQRRQEALVILAYFCVLLRDLEWAWWLQGLSVQMMSGIYGCLDEEHRCWLQWPMQQLGWAP